MTETNECFLEGAASPVAAQLKVDMPKIFPADMRSASHEAVSAICGDLEIVDSAQGSGSSAKWRTNEAGDSYRTAVGGKPGSEGKVTDYTYNAADGTKVSITDIQRNAEGDIWQFKVGDETWTRADEGKEPRVPADETPYSWDCMNEVTDERVSGLIDLGHIEIDENGFHSHQPDASADGPPAAERLGIDSILKEREGVN